MQKSNVDFYPVLLLSILADTLLRLHTGYWARAGLLALPASAAVLAAVLLLVSTSWQGNALLQKVLCVLLAISSALEILRLHALFGSVYPGTLGLAGTCFVVLAPVIYLRREPALRQTANALLVFGAACMAIMVLSVAPRLRVPNLHAAPLTGQDWQAAFVSQLALPPEYLLFALWPPQPGQRCRKAVTFAASALGFDAAVHLLLELFFGAAMPTRQTPVQGAANFAVVHGSHGAAGTVPVCHGGTVGWSRRGGQRCRRAGPLPAVLWRHGSVVCCAAHRAAGTGILLAQCRLLGLRCGCDGNRRLPMADIMHKTSRLMAAVLLGCLLAGCGGQLLSHREIVRAVFFTAQDAGYTVTLLTSDQQSEDSAACKTFTGSGATCAAAWNAAAQTTNGQPFYGLMDLAVLPAGCSWPLAEEIAQLLQSTARPAPEIAVFVLDPAVQMPIQDQTPTLYENLKALEEKQQLHCGLQTLFDNAETAAVPVSAGGEYAMLFYDTAANTARQTQSPLAAQLAAILCGQAHRLDCTLPDDLHLAVKAAADVQVLAPGSVRVNLTLRDVELKDLTPTARPDAELQVAFAAAANREFDGLITALYGINGPDADPLDLCFWLQNRYGSTQGALRAELTLHWHRPGEG